MLCPRCAMTIKDDSEICGVCGKELKQANVQPNPPVAATMAAPVASRPEKDPYQKACDHVASDSADAGSAESNTATSSARSGREKPATRVRGCFGSAWDDLVESTGKVPRLLKLALVSVVPILNFTAAGYVYRWACDAARGKNEGLPEKLITRENFKNGLYVFFGTLLLAFVLAIVLGAAGAFAAGAGNTGITIFAVIVLLLIVLLALGYNFGVLRVTLFESPEELFRFTAMFDAIKRHPGTVLLILFGTLAFTCVVQLAIDAAIVLAWSSQINISFTELFLAFEADRGIADVVLQSYGTNALVVGSYFIGYALEFAVIVFTWIWSMRATGHYVNRYVSEWIAEADAKRVRTTRKVRKPQASKSQALPAN